jgi:uncharacterized protein Yka (UPF0111/DUF47 family)
MAAATTTDRFERIRQNIRDYEREAMEISSPLTLAKGTSLGLSRDQLVHLVGLLWKLSSAYKDYARLLEQALTDIRNNMGEGRREEVQILEDAAANLDKLIDGLQKIEDLTTEFRKEDDEEDEL